MTRGQDPINVHHQRALKQSLASGKVVDRPDALVPFEEQHDIMGMHEIEEMEQRYLTPEQLETKYGRGRKASTAKALGMTIPQSLLLRADDVIQ